MNNNNSKQSLDAFLKVIKSNNKTQKEAQEKSKSFEDIADEIKKFSTQIGRSLLGQDMAIEAVSDHLISISHSEVIGKPQGVFLFVGPPGTGKTYLSELMVKHLSGYDNFEVFDMSNYQSDNDISDFVGTSNTYNDSTPGRLTASVAQYPKSIIVFDEFEKANVKIQDLLLPLFSKGKLQDNFRKSGIEKDEGSAKRYEHLVSFYNDKGILEVDFSQSIIIITTNLGKDLYSNPDFLDKLQEDPITAKSSILDTFSSESDDSDNKKSASFSDPIISRLSEASVVMFNKLKFNELLQLTNNYISKGIESFERGINRKLSFNDQEAISTMLLLSLGPNFDTRNIKGSIPKVLPFDLITDELLKFDKETLKAINLISLEITDSAKQKLESLVSKSKEITREMFRKNKKLSFKKSVSVNNGVLSIIFDLVSIEKVDRVADFNDANGFSLDLPSETFDMIAGHSKVKKRLKEAVTLLKNPEIMIKHGVALPKGILLYGTPGTGKTMLAKALANEADLPFIATTGNDVMDMGIDGIKAFFEKARDYAPCIIFIDEIDSIPNRNDPRPGVKQIVNRLLTEIDGFKNVVDEPIFIVAATNKKDDLDDALIRSGRIEYHIEVPYLDRDARGHFVDDMLNHDAFKKDEMNRDVLLQLSTGMSGAELERVKRECILSMIRLDKEQVTNEILIEQINFVKYGHKLELDASVLRIEETAVHEAGHLVAQWYLAPATKIEQITVMARAKYLGMVSYEHGDNPEYSREWLMGQTCVALAGREAQIKKHGSKSLDAGASSDLKAAMHYANLAISAWGMDESLYNIASSGTKYFHADVEKAIKSWMAEATDKTRGLLNKHWHRVEDITKAVLDKEVLYADDIAEILGDRPNN